MKAPDKIYLNRRHPEPYWFKDKQIDSDIEYIRKNALLEWAHIRLEEFRFIAKISNDAAADGEVDAFDELIDKLNSM